MPKNAINDYSKYQQIKDYLIFNSAEVTVPKQVLYINKNGDKKLINTLTKLGKLSTREKKTALKLKTNDSQNKILLNDGLTLSRRHLLTQNDIKMKTDDLIALKEQYKKNSLLNSGTIDSEYIYETNQKSEEDLKQIHEEDEQLFLSDYLDIIKVNKERGVLPEEMKIFNEMFDLIDNHFKTREVRKSFKDIKFTESAQNYIMSWLEKKNRNGSAELSDFIILVLFPRLKKDNKDIDNLILLLFCIEISVELKKTIDDNHETQFNSYRIVKALVQDKVSGVWSKIKLIKGLNDLRLDYIEYREGGVARRRSENKL